MPAARAALAAAPEPPSARRSPLRHSFSVPLSAPAALLAARPEVAAPLTSHGGRAECAARRRLRRPGGALRGGGGWACRAPPAVVALLAPPASPSEGGKVQKWQTKLPGWMRRLAQASPFVAADVAAAVALAAAAAAVRRAAGSRGRGERGPGGRVAAAPGVAAPEGEDAPEEAPAEASGASAAAEALAKAEARERASLVASLPGCPPPDVVALLYLANPLSVAACVGMSSGALDNAALFAAVAFACRGEAAAAAAALAWAAHAGVQPLLAAPALAALCARGPLPAAGAGGWRAALRFVGWLGAWSAALLGTSWWLLAAHGGGLCGALRALAGHALLGEELEPNIGMWWYFYKEVFEHSRAFFLVVFNVQPLLVVAPLVIRLRRRPVAAAVACASLAAMYKPHPTVSDVCVPLALLPLLASSLAHFRHAFALGFAYLLCALCVPLTWNAWRVGALGAMANVNLFFAATLGANGAQAMLLVEALRSVVASDWVHHQRGDEAARGEALK